MNPIVVLGASAGGISALQTLVRFLTPDFPSPILVVVHIPNNHHSALPRVLTRAGSLKAVHPTSGQRIQPGTIYVAPPNFHMVVIDHHIQLKNSPRENRHRPAIDPLFRSAARSLRQGVVGIILSGVLDDGTGGLIEIKRQGGIAVVQDPDEAIFSSMPESACRYVEVDYLLSAGEIGKMLGEIVAKAKGKLEKIEPMKQVPQMKINVRDESEVMLHDLHDQPGEVTPFACPDCNGNLWVSKEDRFEKYWCHIGHRFTKRSLLALKSSKIEATLFEALRNLKEAIALGEETMAIQSEKKNHLMFEEIKSQVQQWEVQLDLLRKIIDLSKSEIQPL